MLKRSRKDNADKFTDWTSGSVTITSPPSNMPKRPKRKNPAAVTLGRKGGLKGGPARAANMTPEERSEAARKAVMARWAKRKSK
jgi:hypothetical protein